MEFDIHNFTTLVHNFYKVTKRILQKRPLSKQVSKRKEYIELLISSYNSIVTYINLHFDDLETNSKNSVYHKLAHCRESLVRCFGKLDSKIHVPHNLEKFQEVNQEILTDSESSSDTDETIDSISNSEQNDNKELIIQDNSNDLNMATLEQKKAFIGLCTSILRENYDGNPLSLASFLDKINLIVELTEDNLKPILVTFIKSKLEGKAREALNENVSTIEEIKSSLTGKLKPDNSKVIAGKIAALHVRNNNYAEFAKQAEDLADALKRSLVTEGITQVKAHELAIEQTVAVCRLNARSDLVKAILASTAFADPKEVVAKLVVEQTNESKEKQVLAFQNRGNNYANGNNFNRGNNRGNHSNSYSRGYGHYRGNNYRGNNHRGNNYNRNGRYNSNRGNYNTSNNSRGQQNYRNSSNNRNSNNNGTRAFNLNAEAPQQVTLGDTMEN